tara:strand:- start:1032 stop:1247 length:216 start_codon:yes stop_codon:yes gene_type:complete
MLQMEKRTKQVRVWLHQSVLQMEKRTKQVRVWLHQSVLQQTIKTIYFPTAEENKVEPTRAVVRDYDVGSTV